MCQCTVENDICVSAGLPPPALTVSLKIRLLLLTCSGVHRIRVPTTENPILGVR